MLRFRHRCDHPRRSQPAEVGRHCSLIVDGLVVTDMRDAGEKLRGAWCWRRRHDAGTSLPCSIFAAGGPRWQQISPCATSRRSVGSRACNIRHHNFRAITVEADIERQIDTVTANRLSPRVGRRFANATHQSISITRANSTTSRESLDSIVILFVFDWASCMPILGTQFGSYFQPLMILSTVVMAFIGVTYACWSPAIRSACTRRCNGVVALAVSRSTRRSC